MTRTLIIFGQGALRAHPYAYKEVAAVEQNDSKAFDKAFWGHIGHIVNNLFRAFLLSLTRGRLASHPGGPLKRCYQKLAWTSATFALMADIAMGSLGGGLKMKGKITGRYADILGWMYLATCVLRRFEAEGRKKEDYPVVHYATSMAFNEIQKAFDGIFQNLKVPGLTWFFKYPVRWWSRLNTLDSQISDKVSHKVAHLIQEDTEQRDRLTDGIYLGDSPEDPAKKLDLAFKMVKKAEAVERKIKKRSRRRSFLKRECAFLSMWLLKKESSIKKSLNPLVKRKKCVLMPFKSMTLAKKNIFQEKVESEKSSMGCDFFCWRLLRVSGDPCL